MIIHGECLAKLKRMVPRSFDSLVTDPPAGIAFMGKSWDKDKGGRDQWIDWMTQVMKECHRVLKPGAHGFVWALPRTSHWTATACENAGFQIRDVVMHLFGSGFPKSLDVSKAIDKMHGAKRDLVPRHILNREKPTNTLSKGWKNTSDNSMTSDKNPSTQDAKKWSGWGTALKPASEHWILIRRPLSEKTVAKNVLKHGTGAINIDASRVEYEDEKDKKSGQSSRPSKTSNANEYALNHGGLEGFDRSDRSKLQGRFPANLIVSGGSEPVLILKDMSQSAIADVYDQIQMQELWERVKSLPEQSKAKEVLQQEMLLCESSGADGWEEAHRTLQREDAESSDEAREGSPKVEGSIQDKPGLYKNKNRDIKQISDKTECTRSKEGQLPLGASGGNVGKAKPTIKINRGSPSQERSETRQQAKESRDSQQEFAQQATLGGFSRSKETPIVVRESQVPDMWRRYFVITGLEVESKNSARDVMDEQTTDLNYATKPNKKVNNKTSMFKLGGADNSDSGLYGKHNKGGASRFFYCAKSSKAERNAGCEGMEERGNKFQSDFPSDPRMDKPQKRTPNFNHHPCVKSQKLMRYLCKMITPPGGTILDPFAGSGSTGVAALSQGFKFIGIEAEKEYVEIAKRRIEHERSSRKNSQSEMAFESSL